MENLLEQNKITFTPEKCKQIALARLDLIRQAEMYSLMNILKNLPQIKQQTTEPKQNQKSKNEEYLPEDIVKIVERNILGM